MSEEEARALVASVIPAGAQVGEGDIVEIARESGGNPFLLRQLARHVTLHQAGRDYKTTFKDMLGERLRALPDGAQRFLQMLAICGRPMKPELVYEASGLSGSERPLVSRLRSSHLLRSSGSASRIEVYHDQIRETLAATIDGDEKRRLHALMARTLVTRGAGGPETLFEHYREAGDCEEASVQAAAAAKRADGALAFDRAATYYRAALELASRPQAHPEWRESLAASLANAGRPAEAADVFLAAAAGADATRRVELQRLAAEQLLIGGHIDRGLEVIRKVLHALGMRLARGPRTALASLLWRRVQLRWREVTFVGQRAHRVPAAALLRVDTCWSVAAGLALVDSIRAADFHTRHLLLALDTGEPYRIARALAFEAGVVGWAGGPQRQRALECAARAETMAEQLGNPHVIAQCAIARGSAALLAGDWPTAQECCDRGLRILREHSTGTIFELNACQLFRLGALLFQGKFRDVSRELPGLLAAAHERGNLSFETELRTRMNLVWLVADEPDEGERQADEAMRCWSEAGFHRQHYNHMLARIQTELYRGRAQAAWQVIAENWTALERTLLLRVQLIRIEAWWLRGRCALLMAATGRNAHTFLRLARNDARRIARENMSWSNPLSSILIATVAHLEGNSHAARVRLADAVAGFARAHTNFYAAAARRRLGELAHDDDSREGRRQGDE